MPAEDRRRQLIEAAIELFSRKGFAGTTTKEIAAAAGVTEAIVFRHFANKQELYSAILNRIQNGEEVGDWLVLAQRYMDAKDDAGLIRSIMEKIVASIAREPRFERLMILASMEGHELAEIHMRQFALPIGERLVEYFAQRQQEGAMAAGSPHSMLLLIAGSAQFFALHRHIYSLKKMQCHSDTETVEDLVQYVTRALVIPGSRKGPKK